jgi:DNA processing protein
MASNSNTVESWLALTLCPGLPVASAQTLINSLGGAGNVVGASQAELRAAGLSDAVIGQLRNPSPTRMRAALDWLAAPEHHLICLDDPLYPVLLIESGAAPLCLFVAGDPECLSMPQLAIVGSRNATPGGQEIAANFAAYLAEAGLTITSGLALGIDTAAHQGALVGHKNRTEKSHGQTIAVLGCGPDQIYPKQNAPLAEQIIGCGALISEFAPGTPPRKDQFPRRNRIISGLSLGVLVVEAGLRSGSLITARFAGDYGREIFAVPER